MHFRIRKDGCPSQLHQPKYSPDKEGTPFNLPSAPGSSPPMHSPNSEEKQRVVEREAKAPMASTRAGIRLLGLNVSPFAFRARVALTIKGVGYEYIEQDLFNKSELLLSSNPVHRKVPVLIHNGKPICESLVVVQYIGEVWSGTGTPILPTDPYERATSRFWAAYIDDKACSVILSCSLGPSYGFVLAPPLFSKCSNGKAFFNGDSVGYVDIALGCFLPWFAALRKMSGVEIIDAAKNPHLTAWAERFSETTVVKEVLPKPDKAAEYAKKLLTAWAAAAKVRG